MFKTNNNNLDDYADAVTSYISFCEETCIPTRAVYKFNNCKLWSSAELGKLRTNKEEAYRSGDRDAYKTSKYALNKAVKTAKRRYKVKLEQRFSTNDCSFIWRGLQTITNYKPKPVNATADPLLPNQINTFY
ncbi:hypothetical protein AAFF_G00276900 [Aldrovandia affinis]|uniref:Uncharacterized protein n=1 Tax=Aldrovandia affinis TaxID=143900 RepID=A0AAD7RB04_9TELE|nr:hypothetical protein AAFF_G00276900 [Aldrovandia affinis]